MGGAQDRGNCVRKSLRIREAESGSRRAPSRGWAWYGYPGPFARSSACRGKSQRCACTTGRPFIASATWPVCLRKTCCLFPGGLSGWRRNRNSVRKSPTPSAPTSSTVGHGLRQLDVGVRSPPVCRRGSGGVRLQALSILALRDRSVDEQAMSGGAPADRVDDSTSLHPVGTINESPSLIALASVVQDEQTRRVSPPACEPRSRYGEGHAADVGDEAAEGVALEEELILLNPCRPGEEGSCAPDPSFPSVERRNPEAVLAAHQAFSTEMESPFGATSRLRLAQVGIGHSRRRSESVSSPYCLPPAPSTRRCRAAWRIRSPRRLRQRSSRGSCGEGRGRRRNSAGAPAGILRIQRAELGARPAQRQSKRSTSDRTSSGRHLVVADLQGRAVETRCALPGWRCRGGDAGPVQDKVHKGRRTKFFAALVLFAFANLSPYVAGIAGERGWRGASGLDGTVAPLPAASIITP